MITRRTKIQLVFFVIITLVGVAFVGARYARLDRVIVDDAYTVVAHFEDSGGIFAGGEVTYRGVRVGQVEKLELTDSGVDVYLDIDNEYDEIPTRHDGRRRQPLGGRRAVRRAPAADRRRALPVGRGRDPGREHRAADPDRQAAHRHLQHGRVASTATRCAPRSTSSARASPAPARTCRRIIDAGNSFIETANENFDVTTALIRDSNTVLRGQIASESALRTFASQLSLFSGTLADADPDLRRVIDSGSFAANQLRTFLEANRVELSELIRNLVTTGNVIVKRLTASSSCWSIYPYVVEGGFTVVSKSAERALRRPLRPDHHHQAQACLKGYEGTDKRPPGDGGNRPMNMDARCAEPPTKTNARGAQNAPSAGGGDRTTRRPAELDLGRGTRR